jgi:hypothetical protein
MRFPSQIAVLRKHCFQSLEREKLPGLVQPADRLRVGSKPPNVAARLWEARIGKVHNLPLDLRRGRDTIDGNFHGIPQRKDVIAAVIKTLAGSLRENKSSTLLTLLFIIGEVFFEVLIPFYTADMVNMIKAGVPLAEVTALGGKLVLMAVASLLCGAAAAKTCADASTGFARNLREDMFTRVQGFAFENIDRFSSASLVTRMTTDVTNVQMAFMMLIRIAVRAPLMFIFAITMAFLMGGRLALTFVFVVFRLGVSGR